jgi:hypothetical protein
MSKPIKDIELYNALCEVEEVLRREGWCKGKLHAPTGEHCLAGAAETVTRQYGLWWKLFNALGNGQPTVAAFNDDPSTTFEDIIYRIKSAKEKLFA